MALAAYSDLQGLADQPGGIRGQPGAVTHVEPIDGLHQAADRFLEQVGVAEGMMAKAFGHVSGQADIGRGQPMLAMDISVMLKANLTRPARIGIAIIPDEL